MRVRIQVRAAFRANYPNLPDGWLPAHCRASDRGAFWLDPPVGGGISTHLPVLEPHVDVEPAEGSAAAEMLSERRQSIY